ncbi:MAG TPA: molybdopterin-dependent oxidoreductase [Methylomirabilota bacterium]|nr:molybdopterin-dependent oxidoreductase [Methylomirabilota bacterium]
MSSAAAATDPKATPAPAPVETITVKVDGVAVQVPKTMPDHNGKPTPTTMLQACSMVKIDVPHYCYHPKLPVAGNCRMCLVEFGTPAMGPDRKPVLNEDGTPKIAKSPRPAIACATPISPGMEIYTQTPGVADARKAVLEFLLINHPLDCPICDQAGECKLQEYSVEHGQASSRFVEAKVHKPKRVDLGPRIVLDDERCILCTRCIRFTKDVVGDDALGIVNRGSYNTITNYPGKPFDNNYTLNTVDICPVGALTSKDFRFQMRVWFLKESKSICTSCGTGCNTVVGSRADKMYRYEPRENDAVNSNWMCDYGRLNYKWVNREDRLTNIVVRGATGHPEVSTWPMVTDEITRKLSALTPGSLAIVGSARCTNEELFLLSQLAKKFGAVTDSIPRLGEGDRLLLNPDRNPNSVGARLMGIAANPMGSNLSKIADGIRNGKIKALFVYNEDLTKSGISAELLRKLDLLVVSDILPSATTELAHYLLPGASHLEKRGTFTNVKGRVQKFFKALEPKGSARPEWEFLHDIVFNVTGKDGYSTIEGLFNQMAAQTPAFAGVTWASLGDNGVSIQI